MQLLRRKKQAWQKHRKQKPTSRSCREIPAKKPVKGHEASILALGLLSPTLELTSHSHIVGYTVVKAAGILAEPKHVLHKLQPPVAIRLKGSPVLKRGEARPLPSD